MIEALIRLCESQLRTLEMLRDSLARSGIDHNALDERITETTAIVFQARLGLAPNTYRENDGSEL